MVLLLQVLGITNYSHWPGSDGLRSCMAQNASMRSELQGFALKRLARFTHVGTTERLHESAESAAASIGRPLDGRVATLPLPPPEVGEGHHEGIMPLNP